MAGLTPAITRETGTRWLAADLESLAKVARKEWRLVLGAVLICLTVAGLYVARTRRMYLATARIMVLQQSGRPLSVANAETSRLVEGIEDYLPTHSGVIRSPAIVDRAIKSVGLAELPTLQAAAREKLNPVDVAIEQLSVTRPDRTAKILRINYQTGSRAEAVRMVEAVIASYDEFLEENYRQNNNRVIPLITRAREEMRVEMEDMEKKYLEFRSKTPLLSTDETGRSFVARRLDHWDQIETRLEDKAMELEEQLQLGRKLAWEGAGMWSVAHALGQLGSDTNSLLTQVAGSANLLSGDYIRQLSQEQQKLAERHGPEFSKVRALQDQISRVQESMRETRSRIDRGETQDLLRSVQESYDAVNRLKSTITARFEDDLVKAKKVEIDLLTDANLRGNLERQKALFNTVVDQLKQAQLSSDFSSVSARTIEPPNAYPDAVKPRVTLTLFIATLSGLMLGITAALVADRLDTRVTSLEEIRGIFEHKILGIVPQLSKDQAASPAMVGLLSHAMPRSPAAEAYKLIRTNIDVLRRTEATHVVLVTSPSSGDGKSITASNLAINIAQVGRRVLLVDADLRRPNQDRIHDLDDGRGLVHVLKGMLPFEAVVQDSVVENLSLIAAGPEVTNPAELLASDEMARFVARARQLYDVVIIDSPPLLAVADPAIIGPLADGVILVFRDGALRRCDAERAAEGLKALGSPVFGVIVNGFNFETSGYGYGYGYGQGASGRLGRAKIGDDPRTNGRPRARDDGGPDHPPGDRPDPVGPIPGHPSSNGLQ